MKKMLLALALALPALAGAQKVPANVAVPFYTPPHFMQGVHAHWFAPRARDFAQEAAALGPALEKVCAGSIGALRPARAQWEATALAWDRLSAVAIGPLVQRRSLRQVDFWPTRPQLIERAIRANPKDLRALERVGTPAKGLPALEWLLWTQPIAAGTPSCRYAVLLAGELDAEARALAQGFAELAAKDWNADPEAATAAMGELLNQWVGGIERLRWAHIEKPVRSAGGEAPEWPRQASGSTNASWNAQWQGLGTLATAAGNNVPMPGRGLVPLETYLRGRGLNPLADQLAARVSQLTRQLYASETVDEKRALAISRPLSGLKRLAEAEVAPALEVNIGFSDADGD